MQLSHVSRRVTDNSLLVFALAVAAAAGIAIGRWMVPAGDGTPAAVTTVNQPGLAVVPVEAPASAGHVIGMKFEPPAVPIYENAYGPGVYLSPESLPEGHAIGVWFASAFVSPDSPAEGHVLGVRFR
jgi:hypothetical protein